MFISASAVEIFTPTSSEMSGPSPTSVEVFGSMLKETLGPSSRDVLSVCKGDFTPRPEALRHR